MFRATCPAIFLRHFETSCNALKSLLKVEIELRAMHVAANRKRCSTLPFQGRYTKQIFAQLLLQQNCKKITRITSA